MIEKLLNNYMEVFKNPLVLIIMFCFLSYSTYTDLKNKKIYTVSNGLFLLCRIILIFIPVYNLKFNLNSLLGGIGVWLLMIIPAVIVMAKMGGDIKLGIVLGLYLGLDLSLIFLILTVIISLIHLGIKIYIKKDMTTKTYVPYAPYFLISFIVMMLFSFLI
ncbi:MAG: hypothetical protein GX889_11990 [Clostridiales bacterium]|nr:hypothetical protein [Clostridiales bacterium]